MPEHTMEVLDDDIEPSRYMRASVLNNNFARIVGRRDVWGRWVKIASYEKSNTASCTAWALRKRYPPEHGWSIRSKKLNGRSWLLARYQPEDS